MIQARTVLRKAVVTHRPEPEQRAADLVDHPAVQKRHALSGRLERAQSKTQIRVQEWAQVRCARRGAADLRAL